MSTIIGVGVVGILILGAVLMFMYRKNTLTGSEPASITALIAILFTSGLDGGFILLPLFEYNQYTTDEVYQFTNPLGSPNRINVISDIFFTFFAFGGSIIPL